jgi:putative oxidoreductase
MDDLFLLGRLIFGGFFLYNGANHFLMNATLVQYAAAKGVPMPEVAVVVAGVLLLIGGFSVLTGIEPYVGLSCIALFLVCVTPVMHNFWTLTNPADRANVMGHFLSNVALLGGTLMMFAIPQPWPYSVDLRRRARV